MAITEKIVRRTKEFCKEVNKLNFSYDGYIYNPLDYAWNMHKAYLEKYVRESVQILFLGMNPGPFGMMQTGIPFGEINAVKNYLCLNKIISKPKIEHPNRPVLGLSTTRSEGSGKRLWTLISLLWPNVNDFFENHIVLNYCPLGFLDNSKTAKNFTPDHLLKEERIELEKVCDSYLKDVINILKPKALIGIGKYAQNKLMLVNDDKTRIVDSIIHPSPANPLANSNWDAITIEKMRSLGLWK